MNTPLLSLSLYQKKAVDVCVFWTFRNDGEVLTRDARCGAGGGGGGVEERRDRVLSGLLLTKPTRVT